MYHYTYEVSTSNPTDSRQKYIGVRSSECYPTEDSYYGSCKSFTEWQKVNGTESLAKKIFAIHQTRELAMEHEIKLHELFDVAVNEGYFNRSKAHATKFDRTGCTASEETKAKLRAIKKGVKPSEATLEAAKLTNTGREPWNKGKVGVMPTPWNKGGAYYSDVTRKKMSASRKGRSYQDIFGDKADEILEKRRVAMLGDNNPNANRDYTEADRKKMGDVNRGKCWYNNGEISKMFINGTEPDGFIKGRGKVLWQS